MSPVSAQFLMHNATQRTEINLHCGFWNIFPVFTFIIISIYHICTSKVLIVVLLMKGLVLFPVTVWPASWWFLAAIAAHSASNGSCVTGTWPLALWALAHVDCCCCIPFMCCEATEEPERCVRNVSAEPSEWARRCWERYGARLGEGEGEFGKAGRVPALAPVVEVTTFPNHCSGFGSSLLAKTDVTGADGPE